MRFRENACVETLLRKRVRVEGLFVELSDDDTTTGFGTHTLKLPHSALLMSFLSTCSQSLGMFMPVTVKTFYSSYAAIIFTFFWACMNSYYPHSSCLVSVLFQMKHSLVRKVNLSQPSAGNGTLTARDL